jgi:hypothetical protein
MLLKVLFYAYMNNIYSCRKISGQLQENIHYMWHNTDFCSLVAGFTGTRKLTAAAKSNHFPSCHFQQKRSWCAISHKNGYSPASRAFFIFDCIKARYGITPSGVKCVFPKTVRNRTRNVRFRTVLAIAKILIRLVFC